MSDIYEQIDNLYRQIDEGKESIKTLTKEKDKKIKELKDICMLYAENVYNFLGNINREHLDTFERLALDGLKKSIDLCISDINFKDYLKIKYIDKNYDEFMKKISDMIEKDSEDISAEFLKNSLLDEAIEDDTDTFNIVEISPADENNFKSELSYNTKTKSFIGTDSSNTFSNCFAEVFKQEK